MALWQDRMDELRVVKPLSQVGRSNLCSVYWKTSKGTLNYGGKAMVPISLFGNERIGFSQIES